MKENRIMMPVAVNRHRRPAAQRWIASAYGALFPARFRLAGIVFVGVLAVGLATRLGLALLNGLVFADWSPMAPARMAGWLSLGALFDAAVAVWIMLPMALLAWLVPDTPRGRLWLRGAALAVAALLSVVVVVIAAAEMVFWNEFGSRFNFIAVDYLVYSREVIGNIRESYPMPLLLSAVGLAALAVFASSARALWRAAGTQVSASAGGLQRRTRQFALLALLPVVSAVAVDARWRDYTVNLPSVQLAGNGIFEFIQAFRDNEIDYAQFYRTQGVHENADVLRGEFSAGRRGTVLAGSVALPIERDVVAAGPPKRLNVVLVSIESMSASFMAAFGNHDGITPRLDALAGESLFFTDIYATGTRTVRGLEALTLSMPPTPGHSIVKRPDNANLFTLGGVLATQGYEPIYLYGGYSYFDNMQQFFGGNGYTVIDRSSLASGEISAENIWGVADEDLFRLTLRELDQRHAAGRPFFAHVMTTSNHRPYSYPAGRIDIPSGSGRNGAVKYTDWAIGRFLDEARSRPWFDDTVFVFVADHCASSRGRTDLPPASFHIPLLIYSPRHIRPARVDTMASQIDVAPTLLALLNVSYRSRFFGRDILAEGAQQPRALLANYQTVGLLTPGALVELRPKRRVSVVDPANGEPLQPSPDSESAVRRAIAYYEGASSAYRGGTLHTTPVVGAAAAAVALP
jgi:phosphoglycerol transferase MdoB-like AlkP superfamily enzyme